MILPTQRHLFDLPDDLTWLNCAYMSPQLHAVSEAGAEAVRRKARPWQLRPEDFFTESEALRALFGRLVGADAEGVALVPSVSYGLAVAAANVPVRVGQRLLVLAEEFPSNVYPWRELAERSGGQVVTVRRPEDGDWTRAVLGELTERTALVAVPHCHWTDGGLVDLVRVGERAREVGAALAVDATQSLGALPLNVAEVRPDFLVAAGYKWLMGPYSLGYLYVSPRFRQGRPIEHNWLLRGGSEDFARLVDYRDDFQPGARRFDVGERSNFVLVPMALEALRQLLAWGVEDIQETLRALTERVTKGARALALEVPPESLRAGHLVGLKRRGGYGADVAAKLGARKVFVSVRGDSIRVSPHLYNTEADVDRLLEELDALV
ncbi:aminotransferase class V-fold PLP-dependent enzyme [Vitiosangium sp. GDMCC 1.1324]|uniref:aminotransferase class V-fold PLP-dependent enzyme n=1 Tax=Vitiosangium sp. (strain GDMCC 1.1324) TaxID=2138576 RepID=UPI000D3C9D85|nr:aminotransferase class V-fold PLP-dependent enzyme [Vitiosangium sp. GDMCC 1.1324]PTL79706.1 aminotransferase [Vitiosangium sp. GDMCC 1.1324]